MAQRPPHLALHPPYLFCFFFIFCWFFGDGQVRWPEGPPHLALNPPYLYFLFFCLFVSKDTKKLFPPTNRTFLCLCSVSALAVDFLLSSCLSSCLSFLLSFFVSFFLSFFLFFLLCLFPFFPGCLHFFVSCFLYLFVFLPCLLEHC